MALSQNDRIAFSAQIVGAAAQVKGLATAQAQINAQIVKLQALDDANKNLLDPVNALTNSYQSEIATLDGNVRTTFTEQDIKDAANKKLKNDFFPNDLTTTVPSLSAQHNVWTKIQPYALNFAIGKNYVEVFPSTTTKEPDLISAVLSLITSAATYTDIQNTTGQQCNASGTCSLPAYTDQATCVANAGVWTPGPDQITSYAAVQTLKSDLVTAVNTLKTFLQSEVSLIVTNDPSTSNQTQNNAAINDINNVIIPALNAWLAYPDFNTAHSQTTCAGFNSYNSNLLAPTKLHSTQLMALQTALNTRNSFVTSRISQLNTVLGSIVQDVNTGDLTSSSGLYGKRYGYLNLRLNLMGGSLAQLSASQSATTAQTNITNNIKSTSSTYMTFLPTSSFKSPSNGTSIVHVLSASLFSQGDTVFIMADDQQEIQRAVKSINGDAITLNDVVPAGYASNARMYKDIS